MRIGLITYHHSVNYGAMLQCYATVRALQQLGHQVELINVRQEEGRSNFPVFYFKLKALKRFRQRYYPLETEEFHTIEELQSSNLDYDCLVVGSDQVWNPDISKDKCIVYFLDFGGEKIKRVSYASSFGLTEWPEGKMNLLPKIKRALSRFDAISVRESDGVKLLSEVFGLDGKVVVDPTMLHDNYNEITGPIANNGKVVAYLLNRTPDQLKKTRDLAKQYGQRPLMISTIRPYRGFKYVYPPSIEQWIKYIGGASLVVTDSFHGLVFSVLYKRNFVVITPENGRNSRLKNLMQTLGLMDRYYNDMDDIDYKRFARENVDYDKVMVILDKQRSLSWSFLKDSLCRM